MQEFIAHWTAVNTDQGINPLVLTGGYAIGNLQSDRTALEAKITAVEGADNTRQNAANDRDLKKDPLRERIRQFRAAVQAFLKGSQYVKSAPKLPPFNSSPGEFMKALDDMANLWTTINAFPPPGFTPPLKLQGNYLVAAFNTDVTAMRTAFGLVDTADQNATIAREQRNQLLAPIRARLVQYRVAVMALYAPTHALFQSLPLVTPPAGSTPDPVSLSGAWNNTILKAQLVWTVSQEPDLKHYSVRACDPPRYRSDLEQAVAIVPEGTTNLDTDFGLLVSGAVKFFKVYVVTDDDNEKGSNSVKITRP